MFEKRLTYPFFYSMLLYMKKLVLASNNKGKLNEIRAILCGKYDVLSLTDCGVSVDPEETGKTFEENALIKAKAVFDRVHMPVISDDSGLVVYSLDGEPGIYSARYAGDEHSDAANNAKLLKNLEGKPDRNAAFVCCAVYYDEKKIVSAEGRVEGKILFAPEGNGGFGYDPLFFSAELGKSFGVASFDEKNSVSHRARAFKQLSEKL